MMLRTNWLGLAAFLILVAMSARSASAQGTTPHLFFDTQIVSFDVTGTAALPLGPAGSSVLVDVSMTKVQDHNSSRSNKTASIIAPPDPDDADDVNPYRLDGLPFDLFSKIVTELDLQLTDVDPVGVVDIVSPLSWKVEEGEWSAQPSEFVFDADAPDFGMLSIGSASIAEYRGHVTVLKVAAGGGNTPDGELDLRLVLTPGTSKLVDLPDGRVEHSVGLTLDLSGDIGGRTLSILGLTGALVEQGSLFNNVVPEPTSLVAMTAVGILGVGLRRWWK